MTEVLIDEPKEDGPTPSKTPHLAKLDPDIKSALLLLRQDEGFNELEQDIHQLVLRDMIAPYFSGTTLTALSLVRDAVYRLFCFSVEERTRLLISTNIPSELKALLKNQSPLSNPHTYDILDKYLPKS